MGEVPHASGANAEHRHDLGYRHPHYLTFHLATLPPRAPLVAGYLQHVANTYRTHL